MEVYRKKPARFLSRALLGAVFRICDPKKSPLVRKKDMGGAEHHMVRFVQQLLQLLLLLLTFASLAVAQSSTGQTRRSANQSRYQATVTNTEASFSFPLSPGRSYRWSNGGLTYEWSVTVNSHGSSYELGFFLFTPMGATMEEKGDIRALLRAGQCSVFRVEANGASTESDVQASSADINCRAGANRTTLTVRLVGEDSVGYFFSERPESLSFRTQIGLEAKSSTVRVPVRYIAKSSQVSTTRSSIPCLTSTEARDLLMALEPFRQTVTYTLGDSLVFNRLSLPDVQRNYPITYLFFRRGFIALEDNGANTFQSLTRKGQQLNASYSNEIPFATLSLGSVDKVICKGPSAKVQTSVIAKPTQAAINILGDAIFRTGPFSTPNDKVVSFLYRNGKWMLGEYARSEIMPSLD